MATMGSVSLRKLNLINLLTMERRISEDGRVGEFVITPLPRGMGTTFGNALRRVLLSSIKGDAITYFKIEGLYHEFSPMPGIREDSVEILLNLRKIPVMIEGERTTAVLRMDVEGKRVVTAADFEPNPEVRILNPKEQYICELVRDDAKFRLEATIMRGVGYVPAMENRSDQQPIGVITLDANYSPVERVTYQIEKTRVGSDTNLDKLILTIETNGLKTPDQVLAEAASFLGKYFNWLTNEEIKAGALGVLAEEPKPEEEDILEKPIQFLGLSKRSENCLLHEGIDTIGKLIEKTPEDLLNIRSFGERSLIEVVDKLAQYELYLREMEE